MAEQRKLGRVRKIIVRKETVDVFCSIFVREDDGVVGFNIGGRKLGGSSV